MKKCLIIISLVALVASCKSLLNKDYSHLYEKESTYKIKSEGQSPFVGRWQWIHNKSGVRYIRADIGERNDTLMIGFNIISNYGNWTHLSTPDENNNPTPDVSFAIPKGKNTINLTFCKECSNYEEPIVDSIRIKLMDENTLVWSTKKSELFGMPYQVIFKRENNKNTEFSHKKDEVFIENFK